MATLAQQKSRERYRNKVKISKDAKKATKLLKQCRKDLNIPSILVTNCSPKKIKVDIGYDERFKMYRIKVKLIKVKT